MGAIFRREFRAYFQSPIGYICLAVFWAGCGWFFYASTLMTATAELRSVFAGMGTISIFVIPLLTMRLFSEDKRLKTDQVLLTAPVSLWELVMGKFLSALSVYAISVSIALVYGFTLSIFATVEWSVVIGLFFGMLMMGGAMIAIGAFISSLTENQIVAAVATFAAMLLIGVINYIPEIVNITFVQDLMRNLSFDNRFYTFQIGTFNLASTVFFLSVQFLFCFLTVRIFEKRRYA
ncbi:MAG: ABC transporter permease [Oscillospiraceae bacterium]